MRLTQHLKRHGRTFTDERYSAKRGRAAQCRHAAGCRARCARTGRLALLAGLPRSDQPGRRHRQRPRSAGRRQERRRSRIRARPDPQERAQAPRPSCSSAALPSAPQVRPARRSISAMPRTWRADFSRTTRPSSTWNLPRLLMAKNRVKLLLNMLIIAQQTIPRGGTLTIDPIGDGETMGLPHLGQSGLNARMPQNIAELLAGANPGAIDAHAVQPLLHPPAGPGLRPAHFARHAGRGRRSRSS